MDQSMKEIEIWHKVDLENLIKNLSYHSHQKDEYWQLDRKIKEALDKKKTASQKKKRASKFMKALAARLKG